LASPDAVASTVPEWAVRGARAMLWVGLTLLCLLFGMMLGRGEWVGAGVIIGALVLARLVMAGSWWVAVAWLIAVPTLGVFFDNVLQGVPFVRGKRVLFLLLLGMVAWQVVVGKWRIASWMDVERRMLQFLAVAAFSVAVTGHDKGLVEFLRDDLSLLVDGYLMPMSAFLLARRIAWTEARLRCFAGLFVGVGVYQAMTAPLETLLGIDWFIPRTIDAIHTIERATGTFGNAAEYGLVVSSFLLLASWFSLHSRGGGARGAAVVAMLLMLAAVVLSKTRAPWVGLVVSMATLYLLELRSRPVLNWVAFLGLVGVLAAVPYLLALEGFVHRISDPSPIFNRIASWATALNIMVQNPITGIGMSRGAFGSVAGSYAVGVGDVSSSWIMHLAVPHNEFLNIGSMTGLLGGALYLAVVFGIIGGLLRLRRRADLRAEVRGFAVVVAAVWVGWVVNACFSDFGSLGYVNILVYFLAGMAFTWAAPHPATGQEPGGGSRKGPATR
jgi:O-antigen ligase